MTPSTGATSTPFWSSWTLTWCCSRDRRRCQGGNHGHAGVRQWWRDLLEVFPDFAIEVIDIRDLGDIMLASLRLLGHGADSESPFDERVWAVTKLRGGKGVWTRVYNTERDALEVAGLRE